MKNLQIIISKLFTWMGFIKFKKDYGVMDKLWEGQRNIENGQGTYSFPNGGKYEGVWRDGGKYGQGTLTFPNGEKYEGVWKDGLISGQGTYTHPDGIKYEGEYKDGKKNGHGTELHS